MRGFLTKGGKDKGDKGDKDVVSFFVKVGPKVPDPKAKQATLQGAPSKGGPKGPPGTPGPDLAAMTNERMKNDERILREITSKPENGVCADCGAGGESSCLCPSSFVFLSNIVLINHSLFWFLFVFSFHLIEPRWVSLTLGVWLCNACSEIHRDSLGKQLSDIKSMDIGTTTFWVPETIKVTPFLFPSSCSTFVRSSSWPFNLYSVLST
jgi:hypothetical protein